MDVRDVLLESILSTIEEEQSNSIEKDLLDDILESIRSLKQSIALSKDNLLGK
jgi:hypothetical protein